MPVFQPKIRTIHSYLAGFGASTALLAACLVMFLMLLGVATFDSWPRGGIFGGTGHIQLNARVAGLPTPPVPSTPNVAALLGGGTQAVSASNSTSGTPAGQLVGGQLRSRKRGQVGPPVTPPEQTGTPPPSPAPSPTAGPRNAVQQIVSGVGNTVESNTGALGDDLSKVNPIVGGVVSGTGSAANEALQTVANQLGPN